VRFPSIPWWAWLLVVLGAALALSALDVGFLSDDYLMVRYWDRGREAVQWQRVAADFAGPWSGVRDMYRPLVTLSIALQLSLHGFAPRLFHLANSAMVTVAALAIAALVRLRFPDGRGVLAFAAGALVLVHPSVVEPSHWILSRTTALEVMWSALSMAAYGAFLHRRLRTRGPAFAALALALASKEGALLLPLSLAAVDVLHARGSLRARVQGLAPFFALLGAFLLFRKATLGCFTTAKGDLAAGTVLAGVLRNAAWLVGPDGWWRWAAALLLAALAAPFAARRPRIAAGFALWFLLLLLPTSHVPSLPGRYDGRLVWSATPALALLCTEACAAHQRARAAGGLLCALVAVSAAAAWPLARDYRVAGAEVARLGRDLAAAAATARPGQPVAPVAIALPATGLQLLPPERWGLLALRPFAPQDGCIASLEVVLPRGNVVAGDAVDASPAQAVLAAGGQLASWRGGELARVSRPAAPPPPLTAVAGRPGTWRAAAPWLPFAAAVLLVELQAPATACSLRISPDLPGAVAFGERRLRAARGSRAWWFDLSTAPLSIVLAGIAQPMPDVVLNADAAVDAQAAAAVRLLADLEPLPLGRLEGKAVPFAELAARLPQPAADATLYLLLPTTVAAVRHAAGTPLEFAGAALVRLRDCRDLLGSAVVHFCWRTDGGTEPPRRSPLDWFVLR
jgi:hypothetical protein